MTATTIDAMFGALGDTAVYGGCEDCDAYQRVEQDSPGIWIVRIHHDDWCPDLRRRREGELRSLRKAWRRTGSPARRADLAARGAELAQMLADTLPTKGT